MISSLTGLFLKKGVGNGGREGYSGCQTEKRLGGIDGCGRGRRFVICPSEGLSVKREAS